MKLCWWANKRHASWEKVKFFQGQTANLYICTGIVKKPYVDQ